MRHEPVVLVVDNEEVFRLMKPVLSKEMYTPHIIHASDFKAGLDFVNSDQRADIIFADWNSTGPKFIDAVRKDHENHNTPVIMMTSSDNEHVINDALRHGANSHLAKPFLNKAVVNKIREVTSLVERRRKRRIHPDCSYMVNTAIDELLPAQFQLIDFSIQCCLIRVPIEIGNKIRIHQSGTINLNIEEFDVTMDVEIFRIEADMDPSPTRESLLVMFRFTETHEDRLRKMHDMLDELRARW